MAGIDVIDDLRAGSKPALATERHRAWRARLTPTANDTPGG